MACRTAAGTRPAVLTAAHPFPPAGMPACCTGAALRRCSGGHSLGGARCFMRAAPGVLPPLPTPAACPAQWTAAKVEAPPPPRCRSRLPALPAFFVRLPYRLHIHARRAHTVRHPPHLIPHPPAKLHARPIAPPPPPHPPTPTPTPTSHPQYPDSISNIITSQSYPVLFPVHQACAPSPPLAHHLTTLPMRPLFLSP